MRCRFAGGILGLAVSSFKLADRWRGHCPRRDRDRQCGGVTAEYGLGSTRDDLAKRLEARLFNRSGEEWVVVTDIRDRVSFAYGDVLSAEFRQSRNYDSVLGQNFMIHMNKASAETAVAALAAAARPGGALFLGGIRS